MPRAEGRPQAAAGTERLATALPLASGELDERDAGELRALKAQIQRASGFVCESYKEKCLRRRIAVRMRARGVHRYADYAALLQRDGAEYERLLATVTINVSRFFRNPEVWAALQTRIVPALFELPDRVVRIWSAGCAGGEEPYSLAILLREHAEAAGRLDQLRRFRITATDIDRDTLAHARRAEYPGLALADTPDPVARRWFTPDGRVHRLDPEIRSMVHFGAGDLLTGAAPAEAQHLVFCRNVIIYFERAVQERLFARFAESLVPGGHLVLGKVETMFGPAAASFRSVANPERVYQRL